MNATWTDGLAEWFTAAGRHQLPWRSTTDPWAVLVSEVMLQQTSVARVLPRWQRFLQRWPTAPACAESALDDVLREWQGLGYPRRARALWLAAQRVAAEGWPHDEVGLRALPGVGSYTARALLCFSDIGDAASSAALPPRDVNLGRVAARAALGIEAHQTTPSRLDAALAEARPATMSMREYAYALFDVGATICRTRPRCDQCPLHRGCAWSTRAPGQREVARPSVRYVGSIRQLRGAVLAAALAGDALDTASLAAALGHVPGVTRQRIELARQGLADDGLLSDVRAPARSPSRG